MKKLIEVFLLDHTDRRVILGLNGGCTFGSSQQGNLTKVLARIERPYKPLLSVLIFDKAFTFSLGNDEEIVSSLSLLDLDLFRLTHNQFNLCNYIVFDFRV